MKVGAVCWWILYGAFEWYGNDKPFNILTLIISVQMMLMILVYVIVMIKLNLQMMALEGDYRAEVISINSQFIVYLIAYVVRGSMCLFTYFYLD